MTDKIISIEIRFFSGCSCFAPPPLLTPFLQHIMGVCVCSVLPIVFQRQQAHVYVVVCVHVCCEWDDVLMPFRTRTLLNPEVGKPSVWIYQLHLVFVYFLYFSRCLMTILILFGIFFRGFISLFCLSWQCNMDIMWLYLQNDCYKNISSRIVNFDFGFSLYVVGFWVCVSCLMLFWFLREFSPSNTYKSHFLFVCFVSIYCTSTFIYTLLVWFSHFNREFLHPNNRYRCEAFSWLIIRA